MKKLLLILMSVIYLTASSGVVLTVHYCMGKTFVGNLHDDDQPLCSCGMKKTPKGCCHTESKLVKMDNVHKHTVSEVQFPAFVAAIVPVQDRVDFIHYPTAVAEQPVANSPPGLKGNKIYRYNRVFRI